MIMVGQGPPYIIGLTSSNLFGRFPRHGKAIFYNLIHLEPGIADRIYSVMECIQSQVIIRSIWEDKMARKTATPDEREAMRKMRKFETIVGVPFLLFMPLCILCHKVFPSLTPFFAVFYICILAIPAYIQFQTKCPHCGDRFYAFTPKKFSDFLIREENLPPFGHCQNCGFHL